MEKINRIIFSVLLAAIVLTGCATQKSDPLAGFHVSDLQNLDNNSVIAADYKNYVQTLSSKEREFAHLNSYYEDGTGQHAVEIIIGINGRWHRHILIYDKNDKRIKTIKYATGYYAS